MTVTSSFEGEDRLTLRGGPTHPGVRGGRGVGWYEVE
jgi:hypothetical protein